MNHPSRGTFSVQNWNYVILKSHSNISPGRFHVALAIQSKKNTKSNKYREGLFFFLVKMKDKSQVISIILWLQWGEERLSVI